MTRRDWLLVLSAYHGSPAGLDPVRVQKAMFLFARSGAVPPGERYEFRPYHYGPMSSAIYSDLDALVDAGLLERHSVPGKRWSRYAATEKGRKVAKARLGRLTDDEQTSRARRLYEIKQDIANLSFDDLIDRVYREHPDMAVNSVFRRAPAVGG
jgi:DNA-binding PadR family transcriptional regulator